MKCTPSGICGFIWLMTEYEVKPYEVTWVMFALSLYAGLTMVTNVPFYSFKDVQMKKSVPFVVIVLIALGIAVINIDPPVVLFAIFVCYGLSGYALYGWRKAKGQRASAPHLKALLDSDPDDMRAYLALGGVYASKEDYRAAAEVYEDYAARGQQENWIKDLKRACFADRLSDHRFWANQFRLAHAAWGSERLRARDRAVARIVVAFTYSTVAAVSPNFTVVSAEKFVPVKVTTVPPAYALLPESVSVPVCATFHALRP